MLLNITYTVVYVVLYLRIGRLSSIKKLIAKGVYSVTYRSLSEMKELLRMMEEELFSISRLKVAV